MYLYVHLKGSTYVKGIGAQRTYFNDLTCARHIRCDIQVGRACIAYTSFASSGTVDVSSLAQLSVRWRQWARQTVRSLLPSRLPYISPCSCCAVVSASSA